jgi:hypothetical protein
MFESPDPMTAASTEGGSGAHEAIAEPSLAGIVPRMTAEGLQKTILPRRPGESRFGPRQYYYPASPSGVVPSNQKVPCQQVAESHLDAEGGRPGFR